MTVLPDHHDITSRRLKFNRAGQRITGAIVAVLVTALLVGAYWSLLTSVHDLASQTQERACAQTLLGYTFKAVADAFEAPPSPNPARAATVHDITRAADRYANAIEVCERTDNHPGPLAPTSP